MDNLYSIVCEVNTYGKFALVNTTADKNNLPADKMRLYSTIQSPLIVCGSLRYHLN